MRNLLFILLFSPALAFAQAADSARCGEAAVRDSFSASHPRYHAYVVRHFLARGITPQQAFGVLLSDNHLTAPVVSADRGPVRACTPLRVKIAFTRSNPILTSVDTAGYRLVNYSLPGHFLHPGKVERRLESRNDSLWIVTMSIGHGRLPKVDERKAESVWKKVDDRLRTALLAAFPGRE